MSPLSKIADCLTLKFIHDIAVDGSLINRPECPQCVRIDEMYDESDDRKYILAEKNGNSQDPVV